MNEFEQEALDLHSNKLMSRSYFNICILDLAMRAANIKQEDCKADYEKLLKAHCVSWDEMSGDMKKEVKEMITRVLSTPKKKWYQIF